MEFVDVLNENGIKTNVKKCVDDIHKLGLCHRAIQVVVIDENNKILIQQRGSNKCFFPNNWDLTISGHVSSDELSVEAAIREIKEEVGLNFEKKDLNFLFSFKDKLVSGNKIENLFFDVFYTKKNYDLNSIKLQEIEVQDYKIVDINCIKNLLSENLLLENVETKTLIKILEEKICANN